VPPPPTFNTDVTKREASCFAPGCGRSCGACQPVWKQILEAAFQSRKRFGNFSTVQVQKMPVKYKGRSVISLFLVVIVSSVNVMLSTSGPKYPKVLQESQKNRQIEHKGLFFFFFFFFFFFVFFFTVCNESA
jgi:hypothetical protein